MNCKIHQPRSRLKKVQAKHTCHNCDLRTLLQKADCGTNQLPEEAYLICSRGPYMPGDPIYRRGDPFTTIYAITSGAVKTERTTRNGRLQTTGFFLRGDIIGAEALGEKNHVNDAYALKESWICELRVTELLKLSRQHEDVQQGLFQLIAKRNSVTNLHQINQFSRSTEERVMSFFRDFARHSRDRLGGDDDNIGLPMNKKEIANYLAITPESLSRILKRLERSNLIRNKASTYTIIPDSLLEP